MRWVVLLLAAMTIGAGPTTKPADETPEQRLRDAKATVIAKLEKDSTYQSAVADAKAKEDVLAQARDSGSPKEKLDASSSWNKSRAVVEKMQADALKADPDYSKADAEMNAIFVAKAKAAAAAAPKNPQANGKQGPAAKPAIGDHLEIGMTIDEVKVMSRGTMQLVAEQAGGIRMYEAMIGPMRKGALIWRPNEVGWAPSRFSITFEDGVLVQYALMVVP